MNHLLKLASNIDIQRLAGIKRVLGIDLTDELIRIVELEKQGRVANKYAVWFRPIKAYCHRFEEGLSLEKKANRTKEFIESSGIFVTYAVSSVRTLGVKTVVTTLPTETENFDEWIRDHYERLIRLSLPMSQLSFRYEVIESTDTESRIEITFVRNTDIARYREFFSKAGLTLLSLGASTRDTVNGFIVEGAKDLTLACVDTSMISVTRFNQGVRQLTQQIPFSDGQSAVDTLNKFHAGFDSSNSTLYVAGEISFELEGTKVLLNGPFGLRSEEALAAGLAVKGFIPEISPVNFLTSGDKESVAGLIYQSLAHRAAIILGSILTFLLSLQLIASWIIQDELEAAEQRLSVAGPEYTRMSVLRQDVDVLKQKLVGANLARSHLAKTLHDLASATPENVWLYKLQLLHDNRNAQMTLFGLSRSNEHVATYLKSLRSICREANLVRSSLPLQSETMLPIRGAKEAIMTFEVKAVGLD